MAVSCRKHTIIPNRDLSYDANFQQNMITYTLTPEELKQYQFIKNTEKLTKPFIIPMRK